MRVRINGEHRELPEDLTVAGLLAHLNIKESRVAVERNGDIVPKAAYQSTPVAGGDELEIVWFVGGGSA